MDFISIGDFFKDYSLSTVIISCVITVISLILDKFFKNKFSVQIKAYLPTILGIVFYFIYDLIISGQLRLNAETISAGIICGSLSGIFYTFFESLLNGDIILPNDKNTFYMAVFPLVKDYIEKDKIQDFSAKSQEIILDESEDKLSRLKTLFLSFSDKELKNNDVNSLVKLILDKKSVIKN